mgnify:CR=1 FL=1
MSWLDKGSLNRSRTQDQGTPLAEAPDATAAVVIIYENNGLNAYVMDEGVDARTGQISTKEIAEKGREPFKKLNLSVSYTFQQHSHGIPPIKLGLHVTNLANSTKIVDYAGSTADGNDLWISQAGRGFFGSVSVPLGF